MRGGNIMSDRRFHTDSRADENFTKDGLETLTGQPSRKWGRYVVKELVDNALEAVEEADTETPTITVDVELEGPHRDRISRVLPSPPPSFLSPVRR
jgi:DNA topoisomerase VI subunit B